MEEILTFFYCQEMLVGVSNLYSERIVQDFCRDNVLDVKEVLKFTGFVYVEVA